MNPSGGLVAKLAALVLATALTAAALLAVRQRRVMAANDLIEAHRRIVMHERSLRQIRADIGTMIAPARVETLAGALGPMRTIPPALHDSQERGAAERALAKAGKVTPPQARRATKAPAPDPKAAPGTLSLHQEAQVPEDDGGGGPR